MKNSKKMGSAKGKSHVKKGNPKNTVSKYCYKGKAGY